MSAASAGQSFDAIATAYDAVRPNYPAAVVERIVEYSALTQGARALEIGCGSGKATVAFAGLGFRLQALEPGAKLAAVAAETLAEFPNIEIIQTRFEDWSAPRADYQLIFAAQSYHWLDPETRATRCAELLGTGGALAVFGHWDDISASPHFRAIDAAYAEHAPELRTADAARAFYGAAQSPALAEFNRCEALADVAFEQFHWQRSLSSEQFCALLLTYSHHRALPEVRRQALIEQIAHTIRTNGDEITLSYSTGLFLARKR